ncbi:MAG: helix-turn-helix domain-containing protein [Dehalococcoidia bacterium]|nr:helix-turn-helix domain-containing protein [Dehalococcoidia bacterium]
MDTPKLLYSVREAAERLSLSPVTVKKLVQRGELPAVRVLRRVLIPHDALVGYVERLREREEGR